VVVLGRRTVLGAGAALTGITALALPGAAAASSLELSVTGDSESSPATSARDLLRAGITTNGWYWIQTTGMTQARRVYCDMVDEGGGWMLVAYSPSHTTTGSRYPNSWSGGQGVLDRMSADTRQLWFHDGAAQCSSVLKMAHEDQDVAPHLATMRIANGVTYTDPGDLALNDSVDTGLVPTSSDALLGTWRPVKGHNAMSAPLAINAPRDWILSSNYWTVCGPSTDLTANGRSANQQGTSSAAHRSLSPLFGMADVAANVSSFRTDLNSYAVYIR